MAARIILPPTNPSLDADGDVASSATLTFYQNETTTLQSIYSASDLLTPLANPLPCDAAGRFPEIWVPDRTGYSVKWTVPGQTAITFDDIYGSAGVPASGPTVQRLTAGTGATYTTPAGVRYLKITVKGGGGGGSGAGSGGISAAGNGGNSTFNSITANGGVAGTTGILQVAGGTGGAGPASYRIPGAVGGASLWYPEDGTTAFTIGGAGGGAGGGPGGSGYGNTTGSAAVASSGGGGGGGGIKPTIYSSVFSSLFGSGGSEAETAVLYIADPESTYTYTVGTGGVGGGGPTNPASGTAGAAGGSGLIVVEEFY